MTARERLMGFLAGEKTDRIPNLNIIMQFAAREIGVSYGEYCTDYKKLAQGNIVCAQKYGIDCVTVMSDPMREAHDYGTDVVFPEDDVPYPRTNLLADKAALKNLKVTKPEDGRRMSENVETVAYYKRELGDEYPVFGWVEGCFAEAADLRGVNEFLMDIMDDETFVTELLELCLEQAIVYARAQVEAGADIIGVGDAISSVAGPHMYKALAGGYQRRLLKAIRDMGAKTKLHICGNTTPFLEQIPFEYVDIFDVDWMVPLQRAAELAAGKGMVCGNYDPVAVLLQGTTDDIALAVRNCAKLGGISAAGCEVPKFTPVENLLAVHQTLCEI